MLIRKEEEKDYFIVENLTREAFWNVYHPGATEHLVLHNARSKDDFIKDLDLVLVDDEDNDKIIGHIMYTISKIKCDDGTEEKVLCFGPVSIDPNYQHKGYGSLLINHSYEIASKLNYPCIVIEGNINFYKHVGFTYARDYNVFYDGMDRDLDQSFLLIKVFDEEKMNDIKNKKGTFFDSDIYFDVDDIDEFDKKFPHKVKEKREGQLD
ncbi:MAG: N-acetyltransferase [Clostridia bacterium]|nr:N-acetyltransferase [Clostridia bacterium]